MNVMLGRSGMLEMHRPDDAEVSLFTNEVRAQVEHVTALVSRVRAFVSAGAPAIEHAWVARDLELALRLLASEATARGAHFDAPPLDPGLRAYVQRDALIAMLYGTLGFVARGSPRNGAVSFRLSVKRSADRPGRHLELVVALPEHCDVPKTKREVVSPWLLEERCEPEARLLLALGIGAAYRHGGWHQSEQGTLTVCLPIGRPS
jgi:hypothetical protein